MFSSLKDIRLDGGFQTQERRTAVYNASGSVVEGDGTTTVFYTKYAPIIDANGDDTVNTTAVDGVYDVVVYVNGVSVTISAIDAAQGKITLAAAPANGATVSISYDWSSIDNAMVTQYRLWAYSEIMGGISSIYVLPVESSAVNADFTGGLAEDFLHGMEVELAAGNLLMVTYTEENDGLHKQGLAKVKAVREKIKSIQKRMIKLFDSESVELSQNATASPVGFPVAINDPDPLFSITKRM